MVAKGETIRIFFNEEYDNLKVVGMDSWICEFYIGERKHVDFIYKMDEIKNRTALYFLCNKEELEVATDLYIGESERVGKRLKEQYADKDWWNTFIVFTSINNSITKSHVKYLEKVFFNLAKENIATINLFNSDPPNGASLSHPDMAFMEHCKEKILFTLKNLGILDLTKTSHQISPASPYETNIFFINLDGKHSASLKEEQDKLTIQKGSYFKLKIQKSFQGHNYNKSREKIIQTNKYLTETEDGFYYLTEDIVCSSLSQSASMILGRAANGKQDWRNQNGIPYRDIQQESKVYLAN